MEPLSELPIWSYSQLSQYEECGEQYRLKRIERLAETPAVWFPAGNAFHEVTEEFDRESLTLGIEYASFGDWTNRFQTAFRLLIDEQIAKTPDIPVEEWRTAGRTKEDIPWWDEHGPDMVRDYVNWRLKNADRYGIWVAPDGTPGIEWEGTVPIGDVQVTMRADRVMVDKGTGATIIVDMKSGRHEPDDPLQLRIYRMVIERATSEPMWYGAFYMARKALLTKPVVLDTTNEWGIEERFRRAQAGKAAGIFTPRPSERNCQQCGFRKHCQFTED